MIAFCELCNVEPLWSSSANFLYASIECVPGKNIVGPKSGVTFWVATKNAYVFETLLSL